MISFIDILVPESETESKQLILVKAELLAAHTDSKQFHLSMQVFSTWKYCRPSIVCRLGITKPCKYLQDSWITSSDRYLL